MTSNEFLIECNKRTIDVNLALENDKIEQALRDKNDDRVRELLDSEF